MTNKPRIERSADCNLMYETNMAVFMIGGKAYTLRGEGAEIVWEHMNALERPPVTDAMECAREIRRKTTELICAGSQRHVSNDEVDQLTTAIIQAYADAQVAKALAGSTDEIRYLRNFIRLIWCDGILDNTAHNDKAMSIIADYMEAVKVAPDNK